MFICECYLTAGVVDETPTYCLQVVYFYTDMDLILLREVTAQNPYRNPEKWPIVTNLVNAAIQQNRPTTPEIGERTFKEHILTLLKHYTQENSMALKKQVHGFCVQLWFFWLQGGLCVLCIVYACCHRSGTDEEYADKKKLLQDINDLKKDAEECARVLALAKKAESEAKKKLPIYAWLRCEHPKQVAVCTSLDL